MYVSFFLVLNLIIMKKIISPSDFQLFGMKIGEKR